MTKTHTSQEIEDELLSIQALEQKIKAGLHPEPPADLRGMDFRKWEKLQDWEDLTVDLL